MRIDNGLEQPVGYHPVPDAALAIIRRKVKKFVGPDLRRFRFVDIGYIEPNEWMAMVSLPDGSSRRFRCAQGTVVDEATVGN